MSLVFNDTTNKRGIVQEFEREIGVDYGYVSDNETRLKSLAASVNLAFDDFISIGFQASGRWQLDDSNHTDYPIITANLVSGQRDYSFTVDGSNNLILDIYKVLVADSSGVFHEVDPVDAQSSKDTQGFWDGRNTGGSPIKYDKTANGIFLDPVPNYNATGGLKVYINREPSYFTYEDTTKKPGVAGHLHSYFFLKPALVYARRKGLENLEEIEKEVIKYEGIRGTSVQGKIAEYFGLRTKDEPRRITSGRQDNR